MSLHIHSFPTEEVRRTPDGERWCFVCRKRRDFVQVIHAPTLDPDVPLDAQPGSWYGPYAEIRCTQCNTVDGDCFPGTSREWDE